MRRSGPLILIVIVGMLAFLGSSWLVRRNEQHKAAPHIPRVLPPGTESTAEEWSWHQMNGTNPKAEIHARDFRELSSSGRFELRQVELDIYNKEYTEYNRVVSASADFDTSSNMMYSDGQVSITLRIPVGKQPDNQLMVVTSSGVHFDIKSGRAWTDRPAAFKYPLGEGTAVGASYDPQAGELLLKSQADMTWRGRNPDALPMHIQAGQVTYKEKESKVWLGPWTKFSRDTLSMVGGSTVVAIDKEHIRSVDADQATGVDNDPDRRLDYSADHLTMNFDDKGQVANILGDRNAHLVSTTKAGRTVVSTDRIDLAFADATGKSSTLRSAVATGHSVADSHPAAAPGSNPPEERVLKSDVIHVAMRPDGNEIDNVETSSPGTLEFIPVRADQPYRIMRGTQMWIRYGPSNQIESFRSVNVTTRTDYPKPPAGRKPRAPALTWSKELTAAFAPNSSQLSRIEQTGAFRYEEGDRRASADKAVLEQQKNVITLTGGAHVSDDTGTTTAKQIVIDQDSGDFVADGSVNSSRNADSKSDSGMLSAGEPVHARARHMSSTEDNTVIRYAGDAVAWQGADRVQADVIEINREDGSFVAHGHVISQLVDKKKANAPNAKGSPAFTIVRAPELIYTDANRLAYYSGGAVLERPDMTVKSRELRAFLRASSSQTADPHKEGVPVVPAAAVTPAGNAQSPAQQSQSSSLDHAFADGQVEVVWTSAARRRTGHAEHAEYYVDEGKVVMTGGEPEFTDSQKGSTHGRQLTWFEANNRLIVNGGEASEQAHSLIQRR